MFIDWNHIYEHRMRSLDEKTFSTLTGLEKMAGFDISDWLQSSYRKRGQGLKTVQFRLIIFLKYEINSKYI